jgi:hypothetical protein
MQPQPKSSTAVVALLALASLLACSSGSSTVVALHAPATAVAGTPSTVDVVVTDGAGNALASFTGTAHFTSDDPNATLPADYQFSRDDAGRRSFAVTLLRAGAIGVRVALGGQVASATVTVAPAPPSSAQLSLPSGT